MSEAAVSRGRPGGADQARPDPPSRSWFGPTIVVGFILLTIISVRATEFSLAGIIADLTRRNLVVEGLTRIDLSVITSDRNIAAFVETVQIAVLGTIVGGTLALVLALWNSRVGAPNRTTFWVTKTFLNVVRAIPDILWALLFVAATSIGALPGVLALIAFSIAVTSKLTSDVLDGIDMGPVEAAHAVGAGHTQMLRTAVVPQILPAYTSFILYNFELNLRASVVLGLVGAGGIGARFELFRSQGDWDKVWGLIVMFFVVVFLVERLSVTLRRRLV